ncbi:MAG: ATP-binding protein, partial [Acidimicrobiales bacterium]
MLRLPSMSVTTRHSASAYPFQCQAGLPLFGPIIGQEVLGQGMFCYDPFRLYDTETLLSPCMLVSGNKGYGKS